MKGSSSANITLEGDNKIFSETGSALHVSDGNVTINGSGSLKAEIQDEPFGYNHNAKSAAMRRRTCPAASILQEMQP